MKTVSSSAITESKLALFMRLRMRDEKALAEIYDQYAPTILGLIRRHLTDKKEAEDLLLRVFVRIWEQAAELSEIQPMTDLFRMAREMAQEENSRKQALSLNQTSKNTVDSPNKFQPIASTALELVFICGLTIPVAAEKLGISIDELKQTIKNEVSTYRKSNRHV
jgi:AAA+ ATPase superfamily predicted ATPase